MVLGIGIAMIVLIPPGAGYDEEDHLVRVWEISGLTLLPGRLAPAELNYPIVFRDMAYRQQGSHGIITAEFWQTYGRAPLFERGAVRREIDTKSVYSPALLLPQAVAMRIFGRSTRLAALPVLYLCRLAGLLTYLLLVWLAVRMLPRGKWILLVLALSPIAVFQAATISPDAVSNGLGFVFIAGCLRVRQSEEIGSQQVRALLGLIAVLFLAKVNLVPLVLLPFLLFSPSRFMPKRGYAALALGALILFIVEVAGWNLIASTNLDSLLGNDADPRAQILSMLANPFRFLWIIVRDLLANGTMYFQTWINGYGYYYWTPPVIVTLLFLLGVVTALLGERNSAWLDRKARLSLVLVFLVSYVATVVPLYISFTPVGLDQIYGVQGRYFVALALLLFLSVSGVARDGSLPAPAPSWIAILLITALSLNTMGMYLAFHVECGTTYYQTGLCYRPLSRDFTDTHPSPQVANGTILRQELQVTCNGLTEVRIMAIPPVTASTGLTRFVIQDPGSDRTLLEAAVPNGQFPAGDWYPLQFAPDWHSAGAAYTLSILGEGTPPGRGVQVLYTTQSEFDLGTLYVDGEPVEEDIVLQYGCATGLRKLWLTGRP